jgi:alpha-tubulin suppressor-like RCC1 family protein
VYGFGDQYHYQLCLPPPQEQEKREYDTDLEKELDIDMNTSVVYTPTLIDALKEYKIVKLDPGWAHTLALTAEGRILSWGSNKYGELGIGESPKKSTPMTLDTLNEIDVVDILAGWNFSLAFSGTIQLQ